MPDQRAHEQDALIRELYAGLEESRRRAEDQGRRLADAEQQLDRVSAELEAALASRSWRLTSPLRLAADLLKLVVRRTYWFAREWLIRMVRFLHRARVSGSYRGRVAVKANVEELKREYHDQALAAVPDRFVLYRIIGNDLVPRHKRGQSRENVEFILDHEPLLPDCEKRWVVNRIVDPDEEAAVIALLEKQDQPFIHLPFHWPEYCATGWDLEHYPFPGFCLSEEFEALSPERRQRALVHAYRLKNNYAMNNNGARNAALEDGRSRAKWVLPWDGNCFLTEEAWQEIRAAVTASSHMKYFVVPMARVGDNRRLIDGGFDPTATEEPQIIFRQDTVERFNPELPYGRRPKVELLWRLGVRGPWERWGDESWDVAFDAPSPDAGAFGQAGWVARLASGNHQLEESTRAGNRSRTRARDEAILMILQRLDGVCLARRQGTDPTRPLIYREPVLAAFRERAEVSDVAALVLTHLRHRAEFVSAHPPSPTSVDDVTALALASHISNRTDLAEVAVRRLRSLIGETPTTGEQGGAGRIASRAVHQEAASPSLSSIATPAFFDAARFLDTAGVLTKDDRRHLGAWARERLTWLVDSPPGRRAERAPGFRGTSYDLDTAAAAAYVGDYDTLAATLRRSHERLLAHASSGSSTLGDRDRSLNLAAWILLTDLFAGFGEQLWRVSGDGGPVLATMMESFLRRTTAHLRTESGQADRGTESSSRTAVAMAYADYYGLDEEAARHWGIPVDAKGEYLVGPRADVDGALPPFWYVCRASALFGFGSTPTPPALGAAPSADRSPGPTAR